MKFRDLLAASATLVILGLTSPLLAAETDPARVVEHAVEAFNRHDATGVASHYAPDAVVVDPAYPEPLRGREAIAKDFSEFFTAFPNIKAEVTRTVVEGANFAFEVTFRGTHTGPLAGPAGVIPATNRPMELTVAVVARLDDEGLIAERNTYYDLAGMLAQLGLTQ